LINIFYQIYISNKWSSH